MKIKKTNLKMKFHWIDSVEYTDSFNLIEVINSSKDKPIIVQSKEFHGLEIKPFNREVNDWKLKVWSNKIKETNYNIFIRYEVSKHFNENNKDCCTGLAKLKLDCANIKTKGSGCYKDDKYKKYTGMFSWEYLEEPRIKNGKRGRTKSSKAYREGRFRKELLEEDRACVITGESCEFVLDAAHLISVKDGGNDVKSNGVVLRTDLHKLFDKNVFYFNVSGKLIIADKRALAGSEYLEILKDCKLPDFTFSRVRPALIELGNMRSIKKH